MNLVTLRLSQLKQCERHDALTKVISVRCARATGVDEDVLLHLTADSCSAAVKDRPAQLPLKALKASARHNHHAGSRDYHGLNKCILRALPAVHLVYLTLFILTTVMLSRIYLTLFILTTVMLTKLVKKKLSQIYLRRYITRFCFLYSILLAAAFVTCS
jgi:hypothetical protein